MFFIVWGRKGVVNTISSGNMQCPLCNTVTTYELKEIQKYFTLFWIPLFPYGESIEYVECQRCKTTYNPLCFGLGRENQHKGNEQEEGE